MTSRLGIAVAVCLCVASGVSAQSVVRFETTMGNFDMVLNPTNNSILQNHVDNMLEYVKRETYNGTWINRAASGFVLQMGGFYSQTLLPQFSIDQVRNIRSFAPIQGHPAADNPPLSNTVGTVALALSGGSSGTNQDSGSSSFFVNLTSNTFLDTDFTVFAAIPDMTTINNIMALQTIDRTTDPNFPGQDMNLGLTDVPVQADGNQVFIKRAFVIDDTLQVAKDLAGVESVMAQSSQAFADATNAADSMVPASGLGLSASAADSTSGGLTTNNVPEPATLTVVLSGLFGSAALGLRRRRA
jgi:cyclophilin family peptidyl-prolyl cis-trans isomerase